MDEDREDRELAAIDEHNRRSREELIGVPLDEHLPEMTTEEAQAMLAILRQAQARKQRRAQNN